MITFNIVSMEIIIQIIQPHSGFGGSFDRGIHTKLKGFCHGGFGFSRCHICPKLSLVGRIRSGQVHILELDSFVEYLHKSRHSVNQIFSPKLSTGSDWLFGCPCTPPAFGSSVACWFLYC